MGIAVPREKHLSFLIHDVARLLRRAFDQKAQGSGLTRAQWQVLAHLYYNQGCNQQSVAGALDIEPITLSRHIDRLEGLGYVERLPDPTDRRARKLRLTDEVQPLLEDLRCVGMEVLTAALTGIDASRSDAMIETLSTMRANLSGKADECGATSEPEGDEKAKSDDKAKRLAQAPRRESELVR